MSYTNLLYHIVYATKARAPLNYQGAEPSLARIPGWHSSRLAWNRSGDQRNERSCSHPGEATADDLCFGIPEQVEVGLIKLGETPDGWQIWMASSIRSIHGKRVAG